MRPWMCWLWAGASATVPIISESRCGCSSARAPSGQPRVSGSSCAGVTPARVDVEVVVGVGLVAAVAVGCVSVVVVAVTVVVVGFVVVVAEVVVGVVSVASLVVVAAVVVGGGAANAAAIPIAKSSAAATPANIRCSGMGGLWPPPGPRGLAARLLVGLCAV